MAAQFAVLCSGQGVQHAGMFDLARSDTAVAGRLDGWLADAMPGIAVARVLNDSPRLFSNRLAQPLIVAASLALWEALKQKLPTPTLAAGYSVGEVAATSVAGALPPDAAIGLAAERAQQMQRCADALGEPQGMLSISGLPVSRAAEQASQGGVFIAIETGKDTCIAGGLQSRLLKLEADVRKQSARTVLLPVGVASHTPLMRDAVAPFQSTLASSGMTDPAIPLLAGVHGGMLFSAADIRACLAQQLTNKIEWAACMDTIAERGITTVLELGPGAALSQMLQTRHPQIAARSIADFRTLTGILHWLDQRIT